MQFSCLLSHLLIHSYKEVMTWNELSPPPQTTNTAAFALQKYVFMVQVLIIY